MPKQTDSIESANVERGIRKLIANLVDLKDSSGEFLLKLDSICAVAAANINYTNSFSGVIEAATNSLIDGGRKSKIRNYRGKSRIGCVEIASVFSGVVIKGIEHLHNRDQRVPLAKLEWSL